MNRLIHAKGIFDSAQGIMKDTGLLIQNGIIICRGNFHEMNLQWPYVPVIDYSEEYVLPGLINTHVHLEFKPGDRTYQKYMEESEQQHIEDAEKAAKSLLWSGVTTVRDAGSSMELVHRFRQKKSEEMVDLPRLFLSGPPVTVKGGHLHFLGGEAETKEELEKAVIEHKEHGCDCIKIIVSGGQLTPGSIPEKDYFRQQELKILSEAAKKEKMMTAAHCLTVDSLLHAAEAGIDSLEHCACFRRNRENGLLERFYEPNRIKKLKGPTRFFMPGLSNNYHLLDRARSDERKADDKERFLLKQEKNAYKIVNDLIDCGMRPTTGTDGGCGQTYFDETWLELLLLVQGCGITCAEALKAATNYGAAVLGKGGCLGDLKRGYYADFITVENNPLDNIGALANVHHVVLGGNLIK